MTGFKRKDIAWDDKEYFKNMCFKESEVKSMLSELSQEKISFGKFVELLNEKVIVFKREREAESKSSAG